MLKKLLPTTLFALFAGAAAANPYAPQLESLFNTNVSSWANDPVLVQAIKDQNAQTGAFSQGEIDSLDEKWRGEVYNPNSEMIGAVMNSPAGAFLKQQVESTGGLITEAFIMDAQGLNVAVSAPTSDYWQGDEAKFQKTYLVGSQARFVDEVELDDSTGKGQGQVSVTIVDPDTGNPIGALTVGISVDHLG